MNKYYTYLSFIRRNGRSGFTLVEMMVALSILTLMAVFFGEVINQVSRSWASGKRLADNLSKGRMAMDLITRDLQTGVFRTDLGAFATESGAPAADVPYCFFVARSGGSDRSLSLVNYRVVGANATLERQVLPVGWDNSAQDISFGTSAIPQLAALSAKGSSSELTQGVVAFRMYFIHANADGTGGTASLSYINSEGLRAKAVGIAMVVIDENTQKVLEAQGKLSALQQIGWEPPADLSRGLGAHWTQTIEDYFQTAAGEKFPAASRSGIRVMETLVFLSSTSTL